MIKRTFIALQAAILISLPVNAKELTLDDYVQKLAEHPQVQQILSKSDAYKELSLGTMGLPDPIFSLGVDNVPVQSNSFDEFLPTSRTIGISQKFPSYARRKAISKQQKQISYKQKTIANFTKSSLRSMLITSITKLEKVKKQQKYANKQTKYYKDLEEFFKGRLESGSSVYWRFSQVDVERSLIEQKLNNLNAERDDIEAELIRLVGEVPMLNITMLDTKNWKNAEDLYPVQIAKEDIIIAKFGLLAAEAATRHNYSISASYKQREDGANFSGEDWFSVKATVSLPIWSKWNQTPKKRAAAAKKKSAVETYDNMKLMWIKNLTSLESKKDAALNNIQVLIEKDSALKEMIASAKRTYESGETSLEMLLDAKINHLAIKSQLAQEKFKHIALVAEINSYIGE